MFIHNGIQINFSMRLKKVTKFSLTKIQRKHSLQFDFIPFIKEQQNTNTIFHNSTIKISKWHHKYFKIDPKCIPE